MFAKFFNYQGVVKTISCVKFSCTAIWLILPTTQYPCIGDGGGRGWGVKNNV